MAAADSLTNGFIFTTLTGAVGWLAKKLYDAPRPAEYAQLLKDRNDLREIIDHAADEARELNAKRDVEYQKLQEEVLALRAKVYEVHPGGGVHAPIPVEKERRQLPHGRRASDSRQPE